MELQQGLQYLNNKENKTEKVSNSSSFDFNNINVDTNNGKFDIGKFHEGELICKNRNIVYSYFGSFKDGKFDGEGKITIQEEFPEDKEIKIINQYDRTWSGGEPKGFKKYTYHSGKKLTKSQSEALWTAQMNAHHNKLEMDYRQGKKDS